MASEDLVKLRTDAPATATTGDLIYLVRAGVSKGGLAEEVGALGGAGDAPIEYTKQRNFIATTWNATEGTEFIINGTFETDTGWTKGTGWAWNASKYIASDASQTGDSDLVNTGNTVTAGSAYRVEFYTWRDGGSAGDVTPVIGNTEGTPITSSEDGYNDETIIATNTDPLTFRASADWDGSLDDVTIYPVDNTYPDLDDNQVSTLTISDSGVYIKNPANMVDGGKYVLFIIQDGSGHIAPVWDTAFKWEGGVAPTIGIYSNDWDIILFWSDGTSMYGQKHGDYY